MHKTDHPERPIHERPAVIEEKSRFGDWKGDTVYGAVGKGCMVTLVDRKSKVLAATISRSREQNDIREAFKTAFEKLQEDVPIYSITLDNGSEFAAFKEIEKDLNTIIYFADAHSPCKEDLMKIQTILFVFSSRKERIFIKLPPKNFILLFL